VRVGEKGGCALVRVTSLQAHAAAGCVICVSLLMCMFVCSSVPTKIGHDTATYWRSTHKHSRNNKWTHGNVDVMEKTQLHLFEVTQCFVAVYQLRPYFSVPSWKISHLYVHIHYIHPATTCTYTCCMLPVACDDVSLISHIRMIIIKMWRLTCRVGQSSWPRNRRANLLTICWST